MKHYCGWDGMKIHTFAMLLSITEIDNRKYYENHKDSFFVSDAGLLHDGIRGSRRHSQQLCPEGSRPY